VTSSNVSPYFVKGTGEGVGVLVGCGAGVVVGGVGGELCSEEHDKRENAKVRVN
jgi:hypothetical protein